jgi:hypothetical protein
MSLLLSQKAVAERMIGGSVNRRSSVRFAMQMPVICRWKDHNGSPHEIGGFSRDISTAGLFVLSSAPPTDRTDVSVDVLLPALGGGTSHGLHLQSEGKVVRVEHREAATGFAVRCEFESIDGREP